MDNQPAPSDSGHSGAGESPASHLSSHLSVLVAEHDAGSRHFIMMALAEAGYAPQQVTDGTAALEKVKRQQPPLILIAEEDLPDFGGFQLADLLSLVPGAGAHYSVIVLTASLDTALHPPMRGAPTALSLDVLVKPFHVSELLIALGLAADRLTRPGALGAAGPWNLEEPGVEPFPV